MTAQRKTKKTASKKKSAARSKGRAASKKKAKTSKSPRKKAAKVAKKKAASRKKSTSAAAAAKPKRKIKVAGPRVVKAKSKAKTKAKTKTKTKTKVKVKVKVKRKPRRPPLDLARFRRELRERQTEMLNAYMSAKGDSRSRESDGTEDYIDYAVSSYDREFLLSLTELERAQLNLVEEALQRIDRGRFGLCVQCERVIPTKRLEVQPWARYCLHCQELADSGLTEGEFGPADDDETDGADDDEFDADEEAEKLRGEGLAGG